MRSTSNAIGLVLLAAGASSRMGTAKQLLPYQGRSLLRYMAEVALASRCSSVVVVLGAHVDRTRLEIRDLPVQTIENPHWSSGVGSSIQAGVQQITAQPLDAIIVMLCDQPLVTSANLNQLIESYQATQPSVIASAYADTLGVPALFSHQLFPDLLRLSPNEGAKHLIKQYRDRVDSISFPKGAIDLDTPEDYQRLHSNLHSL
ncbi:nucleotidyltransferase family protein [Leptolyngbya sp. NIES-2104]|uniref:nucleotidyltransferase family protein n=1 Tax=Leptolyngbya sp. NIES-2104 TaxID=1552121 RepID=UPI00073F1E0C|nr:nucleotidyltransferase family protein [Leptolyngbya sp. NIES-2104]